MSSNKRSILPTFQYRKTLYKTEDPLIVSLRRLVFVNQTVVLCGQVLLRNLESLPHL